MPTTFSVANQAQLDSALQQIDAGGGSAAANTAYTITLTADFSLSSNIWAINLLGGSSVTIDGQGHTIDGANQYRGFFDSAGGVTLKNMTIAHARAQGGDGGDGRDNSHGGGGGGAGLGGGLFVRSGASATLDSVFFTGDSAVGGNGGSPGSTFSGSRFPGGGGGGGGLGSAGQDATFAGGGAGGSVGVGGFGTTGGLGGAAATSAGGSPGGFGGGGGGGGSQGLNLGGGNGGPGG